MNTTDCEKRFIILSQAWYGNACLKTAEIEDDIYFGFYHKDGGTTGEAAIKFYRLGGKLAARVEVFDDAWGLFDACPDLFKALANIEDKGSIANVVAALQLSGFRDATERKTP